MSDDVINALLASTASRQESSTKKTPSSPSESSSTSDNASPRSQPKSSPKQPPSRRHDSLAKPEYADDADLSGDQKLSMFVNGHIPMIEEDGTEHWYDPTAGRPYTLQEIASVMGVTRERVRQIEEQGKRKLFAQLCKIARKEGENPIDWAKQLLGAIENSRGPDEYGTSKR